MEWISGRRALTRPATALRHPALATEGGRPLGEAVLSDRARLALVAQAAGLLSLCEVAGWRLAGGWGGARVARSGALSGLAVEPGRGGEPPLAALLELLRNLFGGAPIAGRGEARRVARQFELRWSAALDGAAIDREISELLAAAPFLAGPAFGCVAAALTGELDRDGHAIEWRAGRIAAAVADHDPDELLAARRWHAAAAAYLVTPPESEIGRLRQATALAGDGRLTAALALLGRRDDVAAETLRLGCQVHLNALSAARETLRRLAARPLTAAERLAATDAALRLLALTGEAEEARDWCARLLAGCRGRARAVAQLFAALAAGDRRDLEAMQRGLAQVALPEVEPGDVEARDLAALHHEVALQLALAQGDARGVIDHTRRRLALVRRTMTRIEAGRSWNNLGVGRLMARRFGAAERAFAHAGRLLRACDGPLAVTLASSNLAETRLRIGSTAGVEPILAASSAANRRSGNRRGAIEDELLAIRRDLVRFDLDAALARCKLLSARLDPGDDREAERLAVLSARVLGWLDRPAAAAAQLQGLSPAAIDELEPEEWPFLLALAGETDRAVAAADDDLAPLAVPLVRGELPPPDAWERLARLEPFRCARFVLDAERVAPGSAPEALRERAAAIWRRMGAPQAAEQIERARAVAWRALGDYLDRPPGEREAIERLLAAVNHPEAELRRRDAHGEELLAGPGSRPLAAERAAVHGDGELLLRAAEFDEPLRALFALFRRDVPVPRAAPPAGGGGLLGDSPALRAAIDRLRRLAASDLPVLVLGENGTGKELAARMLHEASPRAARPWVPVNCAGLSEPLLLDQLFGHARGAFTGADRERAGVFETARGGTLFLDEIGDFPPSAQGSLLRALQEGEICRLGEALPRKVDVRVVAATNLDIEAMVEEGKFRRDLLYRLRAAAVVLPPLRERGRDVLLLAEHFLDEHRRRRPGLQFDRGAREALQAHPWPGNVRELRHAVAAAVALCPGDRIEAAHFDSIGAASAIPAAAPVAGYHARIEAFRRRLIERELAECEGNLAAAARRLGVSRQYLSQFVKKYGLEVR